MTRPLARFCLYPERDGGLFVRVSVFSTEAQFRRACGAFGKRTFGAMFITNWKRTRTGALTTEVGHALFYRDGLYEGKVAHEMLHAALAWAERARIRPDMNGTGERTLGLNVTDEERLCGAQEVLVHAFWTRVRMVGLAPRL